MTDHSQGGFCVTQASVPQCGSLSPVGCQDFIGDPPAESYFHNSTKMLFAAFTLIVSQVFRYVTSLL